MARQTTKRASSNQICSPYFPSSKRSRKSSNPKTCSPYFSSTKRPRRCKADNIPVSSNIDDEWMSTTKIPQHLVGNVYFDNNKTSIILSRRSTPEDFSLSQTICSYGYFCLAPNRWVPSGDTSRNDEGYLVRPLTYHGHESNTAQTATVAIGQDPQTNAVLAGIRLDSEKPNNDDSMILPQLTSQIGRMLRLDVNLQAFHEVYPEAKNRRFGRLYRSPTLFEDVCKTITNCNMQWGGTVDMNAKLCKFVGKYGAFPTPLEIYHAGADFLKEHCRVGYRSNYLWNLAKEIVEGNLDLETDLGTIPNGTLTFERKDVQAKLLKLKGIGPFAANNILQLMGYFDSHPYDTETVRLWKEDFGAPKSWTKKEIFPKAKAHYAPYAPFEFTAYWYDLWKNYERRAGATAPQWSIEQYEAERPQNVTSDHNCAFAHPTSKNSKAAKTKSKPTKKKK